MNRSTCIRENVVLAVAIVICAAGIDVASVRAETCDVRYEVAIRTSDVIGAGTDANVDLTLWGFQDRSYRVRLNPLISGNAFERDQTDTAILCPQNVALGRVTRLQLSADDSYASSDWHVRNVKISYPDGTSSAFDFFDWIVADSPRTAECGSGCPSDGDGAAGWYEVAVFTSSVRGAGTDANIHLTLFGEDGSAGKRVRLNPLIRVNAFESGQRDVVRLWDTDLGRIGRVKLENDGQFAGAHWHVDRLEVTSRDGERSTLRYGRWVNADTSPQLLEQTAEHLVSGTPAELPRQFYVVAHRANSIEAVREALTAGANALEIDVRVENGRFCASHDPVSEPCEPLARFLAAVREQVDVDRQNARDRLALVIFDVKGDGGLDQAGAQLLQLLREHLTEGTSVRALLSVAELGDRRFLSGAALLLAPGEALAVDFENSPQSVRDFFQQQGVDSFGYGNGCCAACFCPGVSSSIEEAVALRDRRLGPRLVYVWTLEKEQSMRHYMTRGVDAILVNGDWVPGTRSTIALLRRLVAEDEGVELAAPGYNPFP